MFRGCCPMSQLVVGKQTLSMNSVNGCKRLVSSDVEIAQLIVTICLNCGLLTMMMILTSLDR